MPLSLKAYAKLLLFDFYLARGGFQRLYRGVQVTRVASNPFPGESLENVCSAIDHACIWYWKRVLCLQRSAATTSLLREIGIAAELVIGVQQTPFKAHAWVEVDGRPVNDKPYIPQIYLAVDRLAASTDVLP
jgi:transglutaminase superfamily protein